MPLTFLASTIHLLRDKPLIGILSSISGSLLFWLDSIGMVAKHLGFIIGCGVGLLTLAIKLMEFYPKWIEFKDKHFKK
jgi:hypothetical protein